MKYMSLQIIAFTIYTAAAGIVFLDYAKAFDPVPHKRLMVNGSYPESGGK